MVLACVCLLLGSSVAQESPPVPSTSADTSTLLFLSARTRQMLPASESDLRTMGETSIVNAVTATGSANIDPEIVSDLQIRHRVRSGLVIDRQFLDDLLSETGAERLLIVQLMFDTQTVLPSGRLIDTATGLLLGAAAVEPEFWSDADWQGAVDQGVMRLVTSLERNSHSVGGRPFVVLPVQSRGIARSDVTTATHTLLETVLTDPGLAVTDPGVLNHLLIEAGHDPRRVDTEGMAVMADALGAEQMLVAELLSYKTQRGNAVPIYDETVSSVRAALPSFTYIARLTDLRSGILAGSASLFHDDQPEHGWFGIVKTRTSRRILGDAAQLLWDELGSHTEEFHD
jgi:hypothetical protein